MRALLVANRPTDEQLAVWRRVADDVDELHVAASRSAYGNPMYASGTVTDTSWASSWTWFEPPVARSRGHLYWVYPGLREHVAQKQIHLTHVLSEPWGMLVQQSLRSCQKVVAHGSSTAYRTGSGLEHAVRSALLQRSFRRLAGFAGATEDALEEARRNGLPQSLPTAVAQHLVPDQEPLRRAREQREITRGRMGWDFPVVLFVGRLVPEKGISWLLEAWSRTAAREAARLVVVGDGSARPADDGTSDHVELLGQRPPQETQLLIGAADLVVVPSLDTATWREHFGRVALEALATGTPLVVSDGGYLPELVGAAAPVVRQEDVAGLAAHIDSVVSGPASPKAELTAKARAAEFSPESAAVRILDLWNRALAGR